MSNLNETVTYCLDLRTVYKDTSERFFYIVTIVIMLIFTINLMISEILPVEIMSQLK